MYGSIIHLHKSKIPSFYFKYLWHVCFFRKFDLIYLDENDHQTYWQPTIDNCLDFFKNFILKNDADPFSCLIIIGYAWHSICYILLRVWLWHHKNCESWACRRYFVHLFFENHEFWFLTTIWSCACHVFFSILLLSGHSTKFFWFCLILIEYKMFCWIDFYCCEFSDQKSLVADDFDIIMLSWSSSFHLFNFISSTYNDNNKLIKISFLKGFSD